MFSSIRARFLFTAALVAALTLPAVLYTESIVRQVTEDNSKLVREHRDLGWAIGSLEESLRVTEGAIYQYPLLLDEASYRRVLVSLAESRLRSSQLLENQALHHHQSLYEFVLNLKLGLDALDKQARNLLDSLSDVEGRFPAADILIDELRPANEEFYTALDKALAEAEQQLLNPDQQLLARVLNSLRFNWAQQVSYARVFIANRAGVFGQLDEHMERNQNNRELYFSRVVALLDELNEYRKVGKLGPQQTHSLARMQEIVTRYDNGFRRAVQLSANTNWRADLMILQGEIQPILEQTWGIIDLMKEELDNLARQNMQVMLHTADTLSQIVWLFVGFMALLLAAAYMIFEKLIRRPILEVTHALEAQGRGEGYSPVMKPRTQETGVLVEAFVRMNGQVQSRQARLEAILDNAAEGIITIDDKGTIETFNNAAQDLFGYSANESIGRSVMTIAPFAPGGRYKNFLDLCRSPSMEQPGYEVTVSAIRRDGSNFPMAVKVNRLQIEERKLFIALVEDVGERMAMMESLRELAEHDSLTGLYNRQYFLNELDRVVENARRGSPRDFALMYIDLDNFKFVNDTLGHLSGDNLLVEVTSLLSQRNRKSDLLARLGGDEFALLFYDAKVEQVMHAAEALRKLLADYTFKCEGKVIQIGCSIGITMFGQHVTSKEDLLVQADVACHLAKRSGRNAIHLYEADDRENMTVMSEDMGWARRIKDAIEEGHFRLYRQPIVDLKTGKTRRHEILLRLEDEDGRVILPAGFLSSAERFGLVRAIDRWVVNRAIETLGRHLKRWPDLHYSINLSAESVGELGMLDAITTALQRYDVPPTAITFEITETVAIANLAAAVKFLDALRALGCKTALDDFGVGYSSFAYLKDLPVDYVKIDGSFVRDIHRDALQLAMVRSMNDIAHAMGKATVAEFVDSEECLKILRDIGVDYAQGYYVGVPRYVEENSPSPTDSSVIRLVPKQPL